MSPTLYLHPDNAPLLIAQRITHTSGDDTSHQREPQGWELIMALNSSRLGAEPLMDVTDKLAAQRPTPGSVVVGHAGRVARPFGLRFTVSPVRAGEHSKTYYTVTVEETTHINNDGKEETKTDYVDKEKED
ncbi:MAG: hypothetical protein ACRDTT_17720 [Pseudonocardiaceae bacterium]